MGDVTYQLPNEWAQARRRLELLAATADPTTIDRLKRIGIKAGQRVLEVGGGGGSITRWLCEIVGPQGVVHSIDIDTRFIDEIRLPQLQVQLVDVRKSVLAEATFDVIHTRYLLAHLPDRDTVIDRLIQSLAPGGWLVIEEIDFFPVVALDHGVWAEALRWYAAAMTDAGADTDWGRRLPNRLETAGLTDVYADARLEFFAGASPRAELWTLTYTQIWDKLRAAGAPDRLHDEVLTALADRTRRFPDFASIGAWGRRP